MIIPLDRLQLKIYAFSGKFNVCSKRVLLSWIKICRDFTLQTQIFTQKYRSWLRFYSEFLRKKLAVGASDLRDDIKLCHWFPKFPFYHCYQIRYKDCLKYEHRMRLVGTPFVPPPPHHHHWHYFDITKLPYQKQYPRHLLQKPPKVKVSLMSWFQDLWWSSTIFRMNMTESCLFVNWQGVYDECPSYDGFSSYDVCPTYQMVKS